MHQQHQSPGSAAPYWVGCSYYLPGARAEWDASSLHKVYIVLDGELTIATEDGEATLYAMDSVYLAPMSDARYETAPTTLRRSS